MKNLFIIFALLVIFGVCSTAYAATYIIKLVNGNTIEANSYRIEKGKVFLKYPVGEGVFSVSQVISITSDGDTVNLLQSHGVPGPAEKKTAPTVNQKAKLPFDPETIKKNVREHLRAVKETSDRDKVTNGPAAARSAGTTDPEKDALIDQLEKTEDEAERAEIEKKLFDDDIPDTSRKDAPRSNVPVGAPQAGRK